MIAAAAQQETWEPVPLAVRTDLRLGGRWTSLLAGTREWLWHRDAPGRDLVRYGAAFVDVGGLEECLPTVRGRPDHGAVWSMPWQGVAADACVEVDGLRLRRRLDELDGAVTAAYRLVAEPGRQFIWAAHALLEVSDDAEVRCAPGPVRLYEEAAALMSGAHTEWPAGATHLDVEWPAPFGADLSSLGPVDGTAVGAVLRGRDRVRVVDGAEALDLQVALPPGSATQPLSIALWRNLGGYPSTDPYRSIGAEPMLGAAFDLAMAGTDDTARVPTTGVVEWTLQIRAFRRSQ